MQNRIQEHQMQPIKQVLTIYRTQHNKLTQIHIAQHKNTMQQLKQIQVLYTNHIHINKLYKLQNIYISNIANTQQTNTNNTNKSKH